MKSKITRYSGIFLAAALLLALVLGGCGRGAGVGGGEDGAEYTIKFSHVVTPETPKGKAAQKFKEVVERETDGRIKVEVYPNSQLYGDEDELQAIQSGSVEMLAPSSAKFTTIAPALQVLDLPFIFESADDIPEVVSRDSAVGQAIFENKQLAQKNIKVLGLWDNGFMQLTANRPIRTPEDMQGLKVRIQPSNVIRAQMETWGAEPTPMAFAEVYNALQQGVIGGQENTYSNIYSQKFHTVQSHMIESNHHYLGYILVVNNEFFNNLPEDLQKAVVDAADQASAYNRKIALETNEQDKKKILETDIEFIELSPQQRQQFKDAVVPKVWDEFSDVIGEDIIRELKQRQGIE